MAAAIEMKSDCSRCAALCCIAYPSDDMPGFSASKEAGEPCPKLDRCGLCTIYETRKEEGFAGCIGYECFGAGQHVVQTFFDGQDWRNDPALLVPMVDTFLAMRPVSDLLFLIDRARREEALSGNESSLDEMKERLLEVCSTRLGLRNRGTVSEVRCSLQRIYRAATDAR